jgi:hypothetical protein
MFDVVLKRFDAPDESRVVPKGRFDVVRFAASRDGCGASDAPDERGHS